MSLTERMAMNKGAFTKSASQDVIIFDDVTKAYSSFTCPRKREPVLCNVNLSIPSGSIFGLLGPSGCGKTTLLRCVVGRLRADTGTVQVFGHIPGTHQSGVPGPVIGYMPQDVALTEELSVNETLKFFGRVASMSSKQVKSRIEFLLKLLQMDAYQHKTLSTLSGGQKRRVSFAVALLHEPKMLILDEPTVGVDPLLRQNIWKHLYTVASVYGVTILVTTHYIEEARMAHNVGLMLNGRLLIQSAPEDLIRRFECATLEEAFLQVCLQEEEALKERENEMIESPLLNIQLDETCTEKNEEKVEKVDMKAKKKCIFGQRLFSFERLLALTVKTFVFSFRHPASILMQLVLVPLTFAVFALSIGKPPFGIQVGIINHDQSDFSKYYVDSINKKSLNLVPYSNYEEAIQAIEEGSIYGALYLNPNFTDAVINRFSQSMLADNLSLAESKVQLALDLTNKQVALTVSQEILKGFQRFSKRLLTRMGINPALSDIPIQYHGDVEDVLGVQIDQFLLPGFMICIIFFMAMGTTTINHLNDKQLGCVDRLLVSGITEFELIIAQLISQTIVLIVLVPLSFVVVFLLLGFKCLGSPIMAAILNILQGVCGLSLGLFVSSITDQLTVAVVLCLAMFFVAIMIQGVIWPLESLPFVFRYTSLCLPSTYSVLGMRSVINHSCGSECQSVILGLVSSSVWIAIFITISWAVLRLRL